MSRIYENMADEQFHRFIMPKVYGSWNLHKHLSRDMDFFIPLSSSVSKQAHTANKITRQAIHIKMLSCAISAAMASLPAPLTLV